MWTPLFCNHYKKTLLIIYYCWIFSTCFLLWLQGQAGLAPWSRPLESLCQWPSFQEVSKSVSFFLLLYLEGDWTNFIGRELFIPFRIQCAFFPARLMNHLTWLVNLHIGVTLACSNVTVCKILHSVTYEGTNRCRGCVLFGQYGKRPREDKWGICKTSV